MNKHLLFSIALLTTFGLCASEGFTPPQACVRKEKKTRRDRPAGMVGRSESSSSETDTDSGDETTGSPRFRSRIDQPATGDNMTTAQAHAILATDATRYTQTRLLDAEVPGALDALEAAQFAKVHGAKPKPRPPVGLAEGELNLDAHDGSESDTEYHSI